MISFFLGIAILISGYFFYGKWMERIFGPDNRLTPAKRNPDGIDRIELPGWKNMLIQLLNIAGIGPVIGVILGMKFGAIVFLILPIGNVIGGAVHDYFSGMISIRNHGINVPALSKKFLGKSSFHITTIFISFALLLVGAVFVNIPAGLLVGESLFNYPKAFWLAVALIFLYYFLSTFLPIDKIIGKIYPIFGGFLILATIGISIGLIPHLSLLTNPDFSSLASAFNAHPNGEPVIPMLFITIACGIISGFHSTQSPIVARTLRSEDLGRRTFYGMMIVEGLVAMVWAAGGMIAYKTFPELLNSGDGVLILNKLMEIALSGPITSLVAIGVVILAITSGDTALRGMRLTIAEYFHIDQTKSWNRLFVSFVIFVCCGIIIFWSNQDKNSFKVLWNYFSWFNQIIAVISLLVSIAYLRSRNKNFWVALIPGGIITFMVLTYILWVSPTNLKGAPVGFGLNLGLAQILAALFTCAILFFGWRCGAALSKDESFRPDEHD